jgi:hypothetical protein
MNRHTIWASYFTPSQFYRRRITRQASFSDKLSLITFKRKF